MKKQGNDLESRLGHRFKDPSLLDQALTPPSSGLARHNQRLEFLGDALLNAAVALLIHREKVDWDEGAMSKLRGTLVCTPALAAWARDMELELKPGPRSPKHPVSSKSMADGIEALLAAVHEDAGQKGFFEVLRICEARFIASIRAALPGDWKLTDAKTALQERVATLGLVPPQYTLQERSGPDHAPTFSILVQVGGQQASGRGSSRKTAEAEAARALLDQIGE